jgi:hypothetical protein
MGGAREAGARARVLGARPGVNPNSSSLAVDVTFLLFGGAGALAVGLVLSALLRGRRPKVEEVGADSREERR